MTTMTPIRPQKPPKYGRRSLRPVLVFGVALVVFVIAVGMGTLLLGGGEDFAQPSQTTQPTQTTAPVPTTTPTTSAPESAPTPTLVWTQAELPGRRPLLVGTGPDRVFATADEVLYMSTNGADWEPVAGLPPSLIILSVTHGQETYLAIGYDYPAQDPVMHTSDDLATWALVDQPPPNISGMAYGDGLFVAVGEDATMSGTGEARTIDSIHAGVWVSSDGHRWSLISQDNGIFEGLYREDAWVEPQGVAHGPSGFVVVGQDDYTSEWVTGVAWHSPDGLTWDRSFDSSGIFDSSGGDSGLYSVTHGAAGYVATGLLDPFASATWFSSDGEKWDRTPSQAFLTDVVAIDGGYLAVGDRDEMGVVYFSTDGRTWEAMSDGGAFSPSGEVSLLRQAAATDTLIVVYGYQEQEAIDPPPNDPNADYEFVDRIWYAPVG